MGGSEKMREWRVAGPRPWKARAAPLQLCGRRSPPPGVRSALFTQPTLISVNSSSMPGPPPPPQPQPLHQGGLCCACQQPLARKAPHEVDLVTAALKATVKRFPNTQERKALATAGWKEDLAVQSHT